MLPHELKSGFSLEGLYPDFVMRSRENRDRFTGRVPGPETYRDLITAIVWRICSTRPGSFKAERQWKVKQEIYRGTRFFDVGDLDKLDVNYVDIVEPAGLTLLGPANYTITGTNVVPISVVETSIWQSSFRQRNNWLT